MCQSSDKVVIIIVIHKHGRNIITKYVFYLLLLLKIKINKLVYIYVYISEVVTS